MEGTMKHVASEKTRDRVDYDGTKQNRTEAWQNTKDQHGTEQRKVEHRASEQNGTVNDGSDKQTDRQTDNTHTDSQTESGDKLIEDVLRAQETTELNRTERQTQQN